MNAKLIVCCFLGMIALSMAAPELCSLEASVGTCVASWARYYFNKASGKCEQFKYGGCGGNANRFKTLAECDAAGCAVENSDVTTAPNVNV